jgi:hypothetical protein
MMIWISGDVSTAGDKGQLNGFLPSELFVRVSDTGLGKTEEKLSG